MKDWYVTYISKDEHLKGYLNIKVQALSAKTAIETADATVRPTLSTSQFEIGKVILCGSGL